MKRPLSLGLLLSALALVACGGAPSARSTIGDLFEGPEIGAARERAPDLLALAESARDEADAAWRAGQEAAAQDHETRARLLVGAAIAEADRVALDVRRQEAEAREEAAVAQANRDDAQRAELTRAQSRQLAADVALQEGRSALAQAERDEVRRARRHAPQTKQAHRIAATALARRARMTVAAARAMGAPETELMALLTSLEARPTNPTEALALADRVHSEALGLLGGARSSRGRATAAELRSLVEAARAAGFEVRSLPRGVVLSDRALPGRGALSTGRATRLADIVRAHPHGEVLLQAPDARTASRFEAVQRFLADAPGVDPARLRAATVEGDAQIVFVAYGTPGGAP